MLEADRRRLQPLRQRSSQRYCGGGKLLAHIVGQAGAAAVAGAQQLDLERQRGLDLMQRHTLRVCAQRGVLV